MVRLISESKFRQLVKITRNELRLLNLKYVDLVFSYENTRTHEVHVTIKNSPTIPDTLETYYTGLESEPTNKNCVYHTGHCRRFTMRQNTPDMYFNLDLPLFFQSN